VTPPADPPSSDQPSSTPSGSDQRRSARRARSGRRAGDSGTKTAILDAARRRFAEHGYDGATIRGIAADAAVDPALVHHFYGSKERLFSAAMQLPVVPGEVLTAVIAQAAADPASPTPGAILVRTAVTAWDDPQVRGVFIGLLRSALTSDQAATMLREFIASAILAPVTALAARGETPADPADPAPLAAPAGPAGSATPAGPAGSAGLAGSAGSGQATPSDRAAAAASQMLGLGLSRYVLKLEPIESASIDELVAMFGPTIDRYLTGDVPAVIRSQPPAPQASRSSRSSSEVPQPHATSQPLPPQE
jgi:AcrR family transcriptional regulator